MAKQFKTTDEMQREFEIRFTKLCGKNSGWKVWNDFVDLAAIAISNSCDLNKPRVLEREESYKAILAGYEEDAPGTLSEMLGVVTEALERNPRQDFLGDLFMRMGLGSSWHGQFFTPYHVCEMMAQMAVYDPGEKPYITVMDCACGAGATLIGARNVLQDELHKGWGETFFVGQDLSHTAGMMCYIQLSLLGCAGYVCVADSLGNPVRSRHSCLVPDEAEGQDFWYTPMYWNDLWQYRVFGELMKSGNGRADPAERHAEERSDPQDSDVVFNLGGPGAASEDPGCSDSPDAPVHDQQDGDGAVH